jgi:hypothetical protein
MARSIFSLTRPSGILSFASGREGFVVSAAQQPRFFGYQRDPLRMLFEQFDDSIAFRSRERPRGKVSQLLGYQRRGQFQRPSFHLRAATAIQESMQDGERAHADPRISAREWVEQFIKNPIDRSDTKRGSHPSSI